MRATTWRYPFLFAAILLAAFPAIAQHRLVTGAAKSALIEPGPSPRVLRQRPVALDLPSLAKAAGDASPFIDIAFFDDAVFRVFLDRSEATHSGGRAYSGKVATEPNSVVVIVDNDDAVSVQLSAPGRRFSIEGSVERGYVARQLTDHDLPDHAPNYRPPMGFEVPAAVRGGDRKVEALPPPAADDGSTIDVMVLYTAKAVLDNGGIAQMNANVDAQITTTNTIYANSNVVQRLRLVYKGQVSHVESDMATDLDRIIGVGDGFLDEAPILRDLYQADLVSLWGDYSSGGFCGLGSLMAAENLSFAPRGYNVVASPGCTGAGSFTFAHELGHNMGLNHDSYMASGTTQVTPEAGGALTTIGYAHGYIDLVNRFRTVMSYDNQCNAQMPTFSCARIPHFSNPAISYNNNGNYGSAVLATTGNAANAHERQALNDTRETVANLRTALGSFTGPGILTFLPPAYSVAEGAGTVTLTVARHVGSTGAVSVNYTTNPGTATAGSDYTTKSGTLNWAAGDSADKTIVVSILQDAILEGHETFTVTLSGATGGATLASAGTTATVRIIDDEPDTFPVGVALPAGYTTPDNPNANTTHTTWSVDSTQGRLSTASLQSAQVLSPDGGFTNFGNSDLEYAATFTAGTVSFYYKLSSYDQNFSGFEFQVDNVAVFSNNAGGEVDWTLVSQAITAGPHTLRWRFKNKLPFNCAGAIPAAPGGSNCADRAWIDTVTLPSGPGANLAITQTAAPNPGNVAKDIVFTLNLSNTGPGNATNVQVMNPIPAGATFVWASPGCVNAAGTVTCTVGALANGATAQRRIVVRPTAAATLTNNAAVSATETDPTPGNNASALGVPVNTNAVAAQALRYRLYSPVTKEHHFTTDLNEYTVLGTYVGTWVQEGTVGKMLNNPGSFSAVAAVPYYRLYDNSTRWHHWTTDANEYYTLGFVYSGWNMEGVDGYILPTGPAGTTQLYRLNYPALGALHHWTIDANEYNTLITPAYGWVGEGGSGFVIQ